jgi:hypothetical protein
VSVAPRSARRPPASPRPIGLPATKGCVAQPAFHAVAIPHAAAKPFGARWDCRATGGRTGRLRSQSPQEKRLSMSSSSRQRFARKLTSLRPRIARKLALRSARNEPTGRVCTCSVTMGHKKGRKLHASRKRGQRAPVFRVDVGPRAGRRRLRRAERARIKSSKVGWPFAKRLLRGPFGMSLSNRDGARAD